MWQLLVTVVTRRHELPVLWDRSRTSLTVGDTPREVIYPDIEPDFAIGHFVTHYGEFTVLELRYRNEFTVEVYNCLDFLDRHVPFF